MPDTMHKRTQDSRPLAADPAAGPTRRAVPNDAASSGSDGQDAGTSLELRRIQVDAPRAANVTLRTFKQDDADAVLALFESGRLGGEAANNDTGLDMDDVPAAYLSEPCSNFWVAEDDASGEIVGMIGLQQVEPGVGEIRRLRVAPHARRRGIGGMLLDEAVRFCSLNGCVKVTLDTHTARDDAIRLFEKHQFRLERVRSFGNQETLLFYLNLYGSRD